MEIKLLKVNATNHLNIKTSPFETLYRLEGFLLAQLTIFRKAKIGILCLALSSPVWLGVGIVLGISGLSNPAIFFILLMWGALCLAFVLWLCLYFLIYPDSEGKEKLLHRVQLELWRRRRESFSFANDN